MSVFIAAVNYALAGVNVYYWAVGSTNGAINLGVAVFCFGIAHMIIQVEG